MIENSGAARWEQWKIGRDLAFGPAGRIGRWTIEQGER